MSRIICILMMQGSGIFFFGETYYRSHKDHISVCKYVCCVMFGGVVNRTGYLIASWSSVSTGICVI